MESTRNLNNLVSKNRLDQGCHCDTDKISETYKFVENGNKYLYIKGWIKLVEKHYYEYCTLR